MHRKATFLILSFLLALFVDRFCFGSNSQNPLRLDLRLPSAALSRRARRTVQEEPTRSAAYLHARRFFDRPDFAFRRRWCRQPGAAFSRRGVGERRRAGSGRRRHRARAQCADGQSKNQKARRFEGQASGDQPLRLAVGCLAARRSRLLQTTSKLKTSRSRKWAALASAWWRSRRAPSTAQY